MSGKFFWLVLLVIFSVVGHLGYVLFVPEYKMGKKMEELASVTNEAGFKIIPANIARSLFPGDDPTLVNAICAYDTNKESVKISTVDHVGYWSLSIYSKKGDSYYSINDRQTLGANLQINVHPASEHNKTDPSEISAQLEQNKVNLVAATPKGWVVLRVLVANQSARKLVEEMAGRFKCEKTILTTSDENAR